MSDALSLILSRFHYKNLNNEIAFAEFMTQDKWFIFLSFTHVDSSLTRKGSSESGMHSEVLSLEMKWKLELHYVLYVVWSAHSRNTPGIIFFLKSLNKLILCFFVRLRWVFNPISWDYPPSLNSIIFISFKLLDSKISIIKLNYCNPGVDK